MKKINPVVWFEIYVENMNRAKKFYEAVFQTKLEKIDAPKDGMEMCAFAGDKEKYGANGALVYMPSVPVRVGSVLVYFSCEDCAIEESRVEKNGGQVQFSKFSIGEYGFISMIVDTEGNLIGLHSMQ